MKKWEFIDSGFVQQSDEQVTISEFFNTFVKLTRLTNSENANDEFLQK